MSFRRIVATIVTLFDKRGSHRFGIKKVPHAVAVAPFQNLHERSSDRQSRQNDEFDATLSLLAQRKKEFLAGSLELIGFEEVKAALGDQWSVFATRVTDLAQAELRRSLDPSDKFRRHGDLSFVIRFGNLDKAAAEERAKRTAVRIKIALIEKFPDLARAIAIRSFVGNIEAATLEKRDTSLSDALFARLIRMRIDVVDELKRRRRSLVREVKVLFSPLWHAKKQLTFLNRCFVDITNYSSISEKLETLVDPGSITALSAEIDYLVLTKSIEALHGQRRVGGVPILLIPVDFSTLRDLTSSKEYARLLEAMPSSYQKFVYIEVRGIEETVEPKALASAINPIRPFIKGFVVELPLDDVRTAQVAAIGTWVVSTDLGRADPADGALLPRLRRFVAMSGTAEALAFGANSIGLAQVASRAGFSFVEGTAVHLPVKEPRQMVRSRFMSPPSSF